MNESYSGLGYLLFKVFIYVYLYEKAARLQIYLLPRRGLVCGCFFVISFHAVTL